MTSAVNQKAAAELRARATFSTISAIGSSRPLREIAEELNLRGIATERGGRWHPASVARVLRRVGHPVGVEVDVGPVRALTPHSVNAVVTSPPYARQRQRQYGGVSEADYPEWTVDWMAKIRPALAVNGSVAIVIRPHIRDGQMSDYVLRTRLAVRAAGWCEIDELIWIKPGSPPLGRNDRPRRSWESILWFGTTSTPFCNAVENGTTSQRIGFKAKKNSELYKGASENSVGKARCRDYVEVSTSSADRSAFNHHPAQYPSSLAEWIIRLLCPVNGTVLDPFVGSGTTAVAASNVGRRCIGFDIDASYVQIARKRLQSSIR
jgi:site-specific DNA-methyltransferase (adenine-specific)/site-specific DNA-methyltransferase (cytosine-N4-specific)